MNREFLEKLGLEKEVIDKIMKEHGKAIQSVKPDDYDDIKAENKTLKDTVADLQKSMKDFEGYEDKLAEKDNLIKEYELKNLKLRIVNESGIPPELASNVTGETEEDLKKSAENLLPFIRKTTLPLKHTEPNVDDKDAPYKEIISNLKLN